MKLDSRSKISLLAQKRRAYYAEGMPSDHPSQAKYSKEEVDRIQDMVATRLAELLWRQHFSHAYRPRAAARRMTFHARTKHLEKQ